ncbi:MAG: fimbrial biogenesis outer membrane usher protein, partial [Clostridia bacterium]|nr:fimbrial biogenesis outer membrane usher protein [Deltaproteobacteria bacterium]
TLSVSAMESLPTTSIDVAPKRLDSAVVQRDQSLYLNYDLELQNASRGVGNLELGASIGPGVLIANGSVGTLGSWTPVRGLTSYTVDLRRSMSRLTFGDTFVNTGVLGSSGYFGGVVLARSFALDPFFVYQPTLGFAGAAATPSTLDVYVGDVLVRRENVPAGQFNVSGLPMMEGSSTTRYVLRDAFGRQSDVSIAQYGTRRLLGRGLSDYVAAIGFARKSFGRASFDYEVDPAFLGHYRYGITSTLTGDARFEISPAVASGGGSIALRTSAGVFGASGAMSRGGVFGGHALEIDWSYISRRFSMSAYGQLLSDHYATISLLSDADRPLLDGSVSIALPMGHRASISVTCGRSHLRDTADRQQGSVALSVQLAAQWILIATASRVSTTATQSTSELFATVRYVFGNGTSVGAGTYAENKKLSGLVDAQKPTPMTGGVGYRVQVAGNDSVDRASAELVYQSPWARFDVRYDRLDGRTTSRIAANGSVVALKGAGFYATRAVRESYAVVQVSNKPNVGVFMDNRKMGVTNEAGNVLISELSPYYPHQFSIADADLPVYETFPSTEQTVASVASGGALVRFEVKQTRFVRGALAVGRAAPAYGEITVHVGRHNEMASPLGAQGEFELQDLPAGWYFADVAWQGGRCSAIIEMPESHAMVVELGTLACAVSGAR